MSSARAPKSVVASVLVLVLGLSLAGRADVGEVEIASGPLTAVVRLDPFGVSFQQDRGEGFTDIPSDLLGRYGTLGFTVDARVDAQSPAAGYGLFADAPGPWFHATRATETGPGKFLVATDDPTRTFDLIVSAGADGVMQVRATLNNAIGVTATGWSFEAAEGERFLGFGERANGADQTGNMVETWNEEGPWSGGSLKPVTDPALGDRWQGPTPFPGTNFSMPWFVSSRGYGFLLDTSYPSRFRMGSDRKDAWNVESRDPEFAFRVYAGPTPADVVARFSADVGRQPEPSEWFFGPWYQPSGSIGGSLAAKWRDEWDVPMTVAQTYTHYLPCGAQVGNRDARKAQTEAYHALGYKITTYVNSFVCMDHPEGAYDEGDAKGYFIKTRAGTTYPVPYAAYYDSPWHGIVDFSNPDAGEWWRGLITQALEDGYDGWMEDFGEYVPPDAVMFDGRSGLEAHNDYCNQYHEASDVLTRAREFAQFVRCGYTGSAKYSRLVWGGDPSEDFSKADGLAAAVSQGISMGLSGVAYWGSDIGGFHAIFTDRTDAELQSRWLQFGAFSGIMRTQGNGYPRPGDSTPRAQPWDDDVRPIWRKFAKLRTQLFPYIWDAAQEYRSTGIPMIRHLGLANPADQGAYSPEAEYEYMFGPDILVAPVIESGATTRDVYLPPGEWVDFWQAVAYDEATGSFDRVGSATTVTGGRVVKADAPLDRIPLFVRAGACLRLLPADVDTLADLGAEVDGLVRLADVTQTRALDFGGCSG